MELLERRFRKAFEKVLIKLTSKFVFLFLVLSCSSYARELHEFYRGVRAMGMGNAFTAIADDEDAVFYNPAGLAFNRSIEFHLLNPKIGISEDDLKVANTGFSSFDADTISKIFGKNLYAGGTIFPSLHFPNFVLGYYAGADLHLVSRNLAYPQFETRYILDRGPIMGFGFETRGILRSHFLRFGVGVKWLTRQGIDQTLPLSDLVAADTAYLKNLRGGSASGVGVNVGMQYELPIGRRDDLILGAAWLDVGDTRFSNSSTGARPPDEPNNLTAGLAYVHRFRHKATDRRHNIKLAGELRHLAQPYLDPFLRLHAGMEVQFGPFSFQGGLNQDSLCGGASFEFAFLKFSAVTYGVQTQSITYLDRERRYMAQVTLRFDLMGHEIPTKRDEDRRKYPRKYE